MKNTPFFFIKKSLAALLALIAIVAAFSCQNNSVDEIVNDNGNAKEAALSQSMKIDGLKENLSNQDAYKVANIFLSNKGTRAYSKKVSKIIPYNDEQGSPLFFAVDFADNQGYVLVSASKKFFPIIAYSSSGSFESAKGLSKEWTEGISKEISKVRDSSDKTINPEWIKYATFYPNDIETRASSTDIAKWKNEIISEYKGKTDNPTVNNFNNCDNYNSEFMTLNGFEQQFSSYDTQELEKLIDFEMCDKLGFTKEDILCQVFYCEKSTVYGPHLKTTWHQFYPYNGAIEEGAMGCVTIALGQFMNYYRMPSNKNWDAINKDGSTEQQLFLKEVGESVGIDYNTSDRGASTKKAIKSLENYGYRIKGTSELPSSSILYNDLIICRGEPKDKPEDGHMWVIDGINIKNNFTIVDVYLPCKQDLVSYEVKEGDNPYYPCISKEIDRMIFQYYHMNWGGALSWNIAGNYKCDANSTTYSNKVKFIYKY